MHKFSMYINININNFRVKSSFDEKSLNMALSLCVTDFSVSVL